MSSFYSLLLVGFSVGLGNFAAAIGIGLSGVDARTRLKTGMIFGLFEALMPIVGLLIGQGLAGLLGGIGSYIGAALLILIGLYSLWQAYQERKREEVQRRRGSRQNVRHLMLLGFALSIDNLVVGFALGIFHVPVLFAAGVIGAVSIVLSLIGLQLGSLLGARFEEWSEVVGAIVLIFVGAGLGFGLLQ